VKKSSFSNFLVYLLLVFLAIGTVYAHQKTCSPAPTPCCGQSECHKHQRTGKMSQLDLTDAQRQQIKVIMTEKKDKIQALKNDQSLTKEQKKARFKELNRDAREKVGSILTPEQKQKFDLMKEKFTGMKGQAGERKGVAKKLNLNETQKQQFKEINEESWKQISSVKRDSALSKEDKIARIQEIRKSSRAKINKVLTPEQQQKFTEMKEHSRRNRARKADDSCKDCKTHNTSGQGKQVTK
jgi:Spy/CpxP family protein refolding chaperone